MPSMPTVVVATGMARAKRALLSRSLQLAGGSALGFEHGRLHRFTGDKKVPLANLFVSMLRAVDVPVERFADSTGPMTELRAE